MSKEFKSFFKTVGGNEGNKCHYPTRLDTYGCGCSHDCKYCYAKSLLGKPYVWGAEGPNSFDCSGFTYYVFKNSAGITLPRTSSAQSKYGKSVSKSNLKAGDLIFFDTVGPNNGAVTHVGLYIGNGQFIHAASGQGKVVINNLNSSYYVKAYVNARRVL